MGSATIAGSTFTVTQSAVACTYQLDSVSATVAAGGGTGTVGVTTVSSCAWTATSSAATWLTITGPASGTGNGIVTFSAAPNTATDRTGTLTIGGQTFTVMQPGACRYTLTPPREDFGPLGGVSSFTVTTATGCAWTATPNESWIGINGPNAGSGNGTVLFSVLPSNKNRSGLIRVADQDFRINQSK
jgi:hypothetical protein